MSRLLRILQADFGSGNVWTEEELLESFQIVPGFSPVRVRRKADGVLGYVRKHTSQDVYYDFKEQ